jgi:glucose-6-phosphate isomerase
LKQETVNSEEICINIVSKSGSTTETIVNFEILYSKLKEKFADIDKQIVVTTDEGSPLWKKAQEHSFAVLAMPKKVGGRYSVFSASGLLPLALVGVDIKDLVKSARDMRTRCLEADIHSNPALLSAVTTYLHSQNALRIHNTFFFNPELEMLGKWYRQLMGESIGKEKDTHGNMVHTGIVPIVSVGTTDLHSMAQLYFGGPRVMMTQFVWTTQDKKMRVPQDMTLPLVDGVAGKTVSEIMSAILKGVQITYEKNHLPYMNIELSDISEKTLGKYMQFRMMEMMYLAKLMSVNAFDQPNVEEYKVETHAILSGME